MLLTHASQQLSFPTAGYFSTAAHPSARAALVRESAWRHARGPADRQPTGRLQM